VRPQLRALELGDPPERWEALGFGVSGGSCRLGGVRLLLGCPGEGITGWTLCGIAAGTREIDGLRTNAADEPPLLAAAAHPNGAIAIDHVVVTTANFDRTAAALGATGMALRRVAERRDGLRMGFRRLGPAILELVETKGTPAGRARFWGLVAVVEDLGALADRLGERLGSIRDAVQPGRRIATLRQSAGLGEAVAFMSREPDQ
jgi:hypothetical protein